MVRETEKVGRHTWGGRKGTGKDSLGLPFNSHFFFLLLFKRPDPGEHCTPSQYQGHLASALQKESPWSWLLRQVWVRVSPAHSGCECVFRLQASLLPIRNIMIVCSSRVSWVADGTKKGQSHTSWPREGPCSRILLWPLSCGM